MIPFLKIPVETARRMHERKPWLNPRWVFRSKDLHGRWNFISQVVLPERSLPPIFDPDIMKPDLEWRKDLPDAIDLWLAVYFRDGEWSLIQMNIHAPGQKHVDADDSWWYMGPMPFPPVFTSPDAGRFRLAPMSAEEYERHKKEVSQGMAEPLEMETVRIPSSEATNALPRGAESLILFRSAVSGLWYENPDAAGDVDVIALHGRIYEPRVDQAGRQTGKVTPREASSDATVETKRVAPDVIATVEQGARSTEGSNPSPPADPPRCSTCGSSVAKPLRRNLTNTIACNDCWHRWLLYAHNRAEIAEWTIIP